jgi:hypothetical protein
MANKKFEDKDLEKVSGGGWISTYSDEEYNDAGVEVIGSGRVWNSGYKFILTGEELNWTEADAAVEFKIRYGRKAISKAEIRTIIEERQEQNREYEI